MGYYDEKETVHTCPICQKVLICGPPMSSEEKKIMLMTKGYTYKNFYKHVYQEHVKCSLSGDELKKWDKDAL